MLAGAGEGGQQAARAGATICAEKDKPESPGCPPNPSLRANGARIRATRWLAMTEPNDGKKPPRLTSRPQFQACQSGGNADANLALYAEGLQRDRIGGAADQHIAADADAERRAALCADIIAGKAARPEPRDRCEHAPGQRRFLGDAEIESDFADSGDVAVFRHAVGAQHAAEIGDGTDDEADAGAAAALQHDGLYTLHLLRIGAANLRSQRGEP